MRWHAVNITKWWRYRFFCSASHAHYFWRRAKNILFHIIFNGCGRKLLAKIADSISKAFLRDDIIYILYSCEITLHRWPSQKASTTDSIYSRNVIMADSCTPLINPPASSAYYLMREDAVEACEVHWRRQFTSSNWLGNRRCRTVLHNAGIVLVRRSRRCA